jgi:hypothetical protein
MAITFKDSDNYVFLQASKNEWDYKSETDIEYISLGDVSNILDLYELHLAPSEKIRGNLVFKVNKTSAAFHLSYFKACTDEFTPR